jgi:hypothetical protein
MTKETTMTEQEFRQWLAGEGIDTVVMVEREPNGSLDTHTHPFEARGLVLDGEFTVEVDGHTRRYGPGDVFQLGKVLWGEELITAAGGLDKAEAIEIRIAEPGSLEVLDPDAMVQPIDQGVAIQVVFR